MPAKMVPWSLPQRDASWQQGRGEELLNEMRQRRSCRAFSHRPVPRAIIERAVEIAHTAPSGANRQPWRFVAVDEPGIKRAIRVAAEAEERESYDRRMPPEWLEALEPLGTGWRKPFLEIAPWLVVIFRMDHELVAGRKLKSYYPQESVGLAAGFFLFACHLLGLATLTHTPSPMGFLREILRRPDNERPYLLIPVGYPADDCLVPALTRKQLADVLIWNR